MAYPLTIELVPRNAWFRNVRNLFPPERWDVLRRHAYSKAGYVCEICGGRGAEHPVEAHEKWHYDDQRHVATLLGIYALCPQCHEVKHIGLAQKRGRLSQAIAHLAKVNQITMEEAKQYVDESFAIWRMRSEHKWAIDVSEVMNDD
jgi:hypothetical protein